MHLTSHIYLSVSLVQILYVRCIKGAGGDVNYCCFGWGFLLFFFYKILTGARNAIRKLILEQIDFHLQLFKAERILGR